MNTNQQANKVTITPPDYEVHERIEELLEKLQLQKIQFTVKHGIVVLEGDVGDPETIEHVEDQIKKIPGVLDIQNELIITKH